MYRSRYRRIVLFFARILLSFAFWDLALPRLGLRQQAQRTRPDRFRRSASAFRMLAIQMGGVLIKIGQFLSTRVDVLPPEITQELSGLQDEVPPVSFSEIRETAESAYGMPLTEKFAKFEPAPLAAASLGQVHRARIKVDREPGLYANGGGENNPAQRTGFLEVVVKVQRPNIEIIIATDLAALQTVGKWLNRYRPIRRRADVPALLDEFSQILYEEIDYLAEGRNAETFAANFKDDPGVRVPGVIWTHTTRRTLTLENVWAIKITDYPEISAAGIERKEVASRLLDTYLKQIFEDGFFHADPHPGNLFVNPQPEPLPGIQAAERTRRGLENKTAWQLTFVDFGMVGHVSPRLREGLREMLIGIGTRDSRRVVKSYQILGVLLPGADLSLLEKAEAKLFDRLWGKTMTELREISPEEVFEFASEFRELLYTLPFQIPHDLIYLGRTVSILSGMCTGLYPDFNLWEHMGPYAQKMIVEEARTERQNWLSELESLGRAFLSVPKKMDSILGKMERGEIAVSAPEVTQKVSQLERAVRQVAGGIIFMGLLLGGIQLYLGGQDLFGRILLAGAGLSLVWVIAYGLGKRRG